MSIVQITKKPILPVITIMQQDGVTLYNWNPFTGVQDFYLQQLYFRPPSDLLDGAFRLQFAATNTTVISNLKLGGEVTIWLGKSDSTKTKEFLGVIGAVNVSEPNRNMMNVELSGPDWGSDLLRNRICVGFWSQRINPGIIQGAPITYDNTDNSTLAEQITQDLLTKQSSYPADSQSAQSGNLPPTISSQGLVVSASNLFRGVSSDTRIPQFQANYENVQDKLQQLDGMVGSYHYVDANKNFIMDWATPYFTSSGILLTDDYTDTLAIGPPAWDTTKIGFILPGAEYEKTTETTRRRMYGLGGDLIAKDQFNDTNGNLTTGVATYNTYIAQQFAPSQKILAYIELYLDKIGQDSPSFNPALDLTIDIIEDSAGKPGPFVARSSTIPVAGVVAGASASWHAANFGIELKTGSLYWIVTRLSTGDATHTYRWYHDSQTTKTNGTSPDGTTWTINTGNSYQFGFRTYYSTPLMNVKSNPTTNMILGTNYHEQVLRKPGVTEMNTLAKMMNSESYFAFRIKEIFKGKIYAPDTTLRNNQKVRIRKQKSLYTFDSPDFVLSNIEYIFTADKDQTTGLMSYNITATRYTTSGAATTT